jgi:hypothetical protein
MYVSSNLTTSGAQASAWVCDNQTKVDVVIYNVWNEVGHYTITPSRRSGGCDPAAFRSESAAIDSADGSHPDTDSLPTPPTLPGSVSPVNKQSAVRFLNKPPGPTPANIAAVQTKASIIGWPSRPTCPASTLPDGLRDVSALG